MGFTPRNKQESIDREQSFPMIQEYKRREKGYKALKLSIYQTQISENPFLGFWQVPQLCRHSHSHLSLHYYAVSLISTTSPNRRDKIPNNILLQEVRKHKLVVDGMKSELFLDEIHLLGYAI